tara:strand:+ start:664 stop:843 length:180 start_codon:yes stop_codon:yes gene_type:complete
MAGFLGHNPKTIYDSFEGDANQDAKTLAEYARVGIGSEGSWPTSQNVLDAVKRDPDIWD